MLTGKSLAYREPENRIQPTLMNRFRNYSLSIVFFCTAVVCAPNRAWSQSTGGGLPDNPAQSTRPPTDSSTSPAAREVTWKSLPKDFLRDQKNIWTFPVQLAKGHHWLPTLTITGVTAGLIVADPHVMPYFRDHAVNLDRLPAESDPQTFLPADRSTIHFLMAASRRLKAALSPPGTLPGLFR